ncbi:MAG: 4'-phosphopantetheinyl transferase superfamily protein [Gammaproteobacteria bacterium]|nr:4'-phosphopantetheinyl transferase superfamily protein [Gammaproteobacteria bacterium]
MLPESLVLADSLGDALGIELELAVAREAVVPARLTRAERRVYHNLAHTPRARSWLLGRAALKRLRTRVEGCEETADLVFPNPRYSLSHSRGVAVAVADAGAEAGGLGVDIEIGRHVDAAAARFFLSARERRALASLPARRRPEALLRLWCIKEAVFKANPDNAGLLLADHELADPLASRGLATAACGRRLAYASWSRDNACLALAVLREGAEP